MAPQNADGRDRPRIVPSAADVCRRLRRYCYIKLWDSELDSLFTYANGQRWTPPSAAELRRDYGDGEVVEIEHATQEQHKLSYVYDRLRNESAPVIKLTQSSAMPTHGSEGLPWSLPIAATSVDLSRAQPSQRFSTAQHFPSARRNFFWDKIFLEMVFCDDHEIY